MWRIGFGQSLLDVNLVGLPKVTEREIHLLKMITDSQHVLTLTSGRSALQAQGVEAAVVAKLVGHADPSITQGHYTQPLRDGAEAIKALEAAYR